MHSNTLVVGYPFTRTETLRQCLEEHPKLNGSLEYEIVSNPIRLDELTKTKRNVVYNYRLPKAVFADMSASTDTDIEAFVGSYGQYLQHVRQQSVASQVCNDLLVMSPTKAITSVCRKLRVEATGRMVTASLVQPTHTVYEYLHNTQPYINRQIDRLFNFQDLAYVRPLAPNCFDFPPKQESLQPRGLIAAIHTPDNKQEFCGKIGKTIVRELQNAGLYVRIVWLTANDGWVEHLRQVETSLTLARNESPRLLWGFLGSEQLAKLITDRKAADFLVKQDPTTNRFGVLTI